MATSQSEVEFSESKFRGSGWISGDNLNEPEQYQFSEGFIYY